MDDSLNTAPIIRFATFLSPITYEVYAHITRYIGEKVGYPTTLRVGKSFGEFAEGEVDVAFICGLPYVRMTKSSTCPVELLAAPVLQGERYRQKPFFYSVLFLCSDIPFISFVILR